MLQDDYYYFKAHQDDIVKGHLGELVILKDAQVLGYYKDDDAALLDVKKWRLAPGSFMLKRCEPHGTDIMRYPTNRVRFVPAGTDN